MKQRQFIIRKISLMHGFKSKTIRVVLASRSQVARIAECNEKDVMGCFERSAHSGRLFGTIWIWNKSKKIPWVLLHECYHAAFGIAIASGFRNDGYFPPMKFEECVVRTGEYLTEQAFKKLGFRLTKTTSSATI